MLTTIIKRLPVIGPLAKQSARSLGLRRVGRSKSPYVFERVPLEPATGDVETSRRQLLNLLNYTKTSGSSYAARRYPAGYHSIEIDGLRISGQRDPRARLAAVPVDFRGKTVLDIGSNQGGMLFAVDGIRWGVGIDYDSRMVNAANRIRSARGRTNLSFYVFDLEHEPLELIHDFLPAGKVDVVFLLSVCMWLKNWREVIAFAAATSTAMLFETNGSDRQQAGQVEQLRRHYDSVQVLAAASEDDPGQKRRRLYYCTGHRAAG
jgi:SAM-dependent methyltransferase